MVAAVLAMGPELPSARLAEPWVKAHTLYRSLVGVAIKGAVLPPANCSKGQPLKMALEEACNGEVTPNRLQAPPPSAVPFGVTLPDL